MRKINISQVSETAQHSPKGTFAVFRKHISLALGSLKDVGVFGGGHPFDLELVRVPPGRAAWPLHSHSAQWELYVIISGKGEVRTPAETVAVGVGDVFIHPPEEAHQLRNVATDDLVYYVIADHALAVIAHYPDLINCFSTPQLNTFRMPDPNHS